MQIRFIECSLMGLSVWRRVKRGLFGNILQLRFDKWLDKVHLFATRRCVNWGTFVMLDQLVQGTESPLSNAVDAIFKMNAKMFVPHGRF